MFENYINNANVFYYIYIYIYIAACDKCVCIYIYIYIYICMYAIIRTNGHRTRVILSPLYSRRDTSIDDPQFKTTSLNVCLLLVPNLELTISNGRDPRSQGAL